MFIDRATSITGQQQGRIKDQESYFGIRDEDNRSGIIETTGF
jgi:hypothetical protein